MLYGQKQLSLWDRTEYFENTLQKMCKQGLMQGDIQRMVTDIF